MRRSRRLFLTSLIVALLAGCGQSPADRTEIPRGRRSRPISRRIGGERAKR